MIRSDQMKANSGLAEFFRPEVGLGIGYRLTKGAMMLFSLSSDSGSDIT
jgi:hypothetical protein